MKTVLFAAVAVLALLPVEARAQASRNCEQGSYGPGGCESMGPGGGRSMGPGGGLSYGPGGGLSPMRDRSRKLNTRGFMNDDDF
jgi:hypothetical protein